jgi:hypothetical protein
MPFTVHTNLDGNGVVSDPDHYELGVFATPAEAFHVLQVSEAFTRLALDLVFSGIRLNEREG